MNRIPAWMAAAVAAVLCVYAFAAGSYRLFPFYQVAAVKNAVEQWRSPSSPVYVPATPFSVAIQETAIQRLLVKRIPLPNSGEDFVAGGALARVGPVLYAVNRDGQPFAFDLEGQTVLEVYTDPAPINRSDLRRSALRYAFANAWFRTAGAYAEELNDSTHALFVYHNRLDVDEACITYNISRVELVRRGMRLEAPDPWRTILTTEPCMVMQPEGGYGRYRWSGHISGGKIIEYDDRRLLITVGDFTFDGYLRDAWSMDPAVPYGKYVLVDKETGASEVYATGARNNMGLFRDRDGTIWSTESGPQGGDELNVVARGANFGWPNVSYGINYETNPWPLNPHQGRHDEYDKPVFAWFPSIVPTNLVRVDSTSGRFADWHGDLIMGTLRDESLRRLRLDDDGRVVYDERIRFGERIRDLIYLHDGTIAFLTDNSGHLVILDDGGPVYEPLDESAELRRLILEGYDALTTDEARAGAVVVSAEGLYEQKCVSCHALTEDHLVGPHLVGLFDRQIGGAEGFGYSYEMAVSTDRWTPGRLERFLIDPEREFPGVRMQKVTLAPPELDSIVAYLRRGDFD